jgi:hypothetical protein
MSAAACGQRDQRARERTHGQLRAQVSDHLP